MENIEPWLALKSVPGIGNHLFKRLIGRFKSPEFVFNAPEEDLLRVEGINKRLVSSLRRHKMPDHLKRELDRVIKNGFSIVTMSDPDYPCLLLEIPDPPPFLYVLGALEKSANCIAIVGSRNATGYGITITRRLSRDLAAFNITVVSGMAIGIDTAAHEGALQGNGRTIAVLGSGLLRIYPAQNKKLFYKIAERGAVISEFPLMAEPEAHNFPIRNRIISGISLGVVVVEAGRKSGSLITARLAAEQNREVFAVPGSIQSFKSTGTHTLIKEGAKLVEHPQDIIEELSNALISRNGKKKKIDKIHRLPPLSADELKVFDELGAYPVHIDDLVRKILIEPGKLSGILLQLELKGVVQQAPGKLFKKANEEVN